MIGTRFHRSVLLFTMALVSYAYFYQAGGWNQNSRFDLTRAMVEVRQLRIDGYEWNTGDRSCRGPAGACKRADPTAGDHYYSDKAPGLSFLAIPAYAALFVPFGSAQPSPRFIAWTSYIATILAIAVPSAIGVVALFHLLLTLGLTVGGATLISGSYALATMAFPLSTLFFGHQLAASLLIIGFAILAHARSRRTTDRAAFLLGLAAGMALGYSVVTEYTSALAVLPMFLYAAFVVRSKALTAGVVSGGAFCAALMLAYHSAAFGSAFALPYDFSTQPHRHVNFMGLGRPNFEALLNITFTPFRGLFFESPWLLLAVPGTVALVRAARARAEVLVCVATVVLFFWLNASLVDWEGGWIFGPRYLGPAVPFLAVLAGGILLPAPGIRMRIGHAVLAVLAIWSFAAALTATAVNPQVPVGYRDPYREYLFPRLLEGRVADNTQAFYEFAPGSDPTREAWNAGQFMGLDGAASLLPLLLFIGLLTAWMAQTTKRGANSATLDAVPAACDASWRSIPE